MKKLFLILAILFFPSIALAQSQRNPCFYNVAPSNTDGCTAVSTTKPLPTYQGGATFTNITTSTDTIIKTTAGTLQGFTVNTAGTTSSVVFYDNTTCTGTKIGTYGTTAQTSIKIDAAFTVGLCATTAGGAAADITVLWR